MSPAVALIFWSFSLFQLKHLVCDYMLQTEFQWRNKGRYGHPGGFLHAGIHVLGSLPAILVWTRAPAVIAALLVGEFVIHYHVDWTKEQVNKHRHLTPHDALFWAVFGTDQFLHQMTYVVIVAILARGVAF